MIRRFIPLAFFTVATLAVAKSNKPPEAPEPPGLTEIIRDNASSSSTSFEVTNRAQQDDTRSTDTAAPPHPQIKVIRKADATMEEYRFNNKLYMVKVIPKVGKPYYLYDEEGTGNLTHRDDAHSQTTPPRWTLFEW